MDPHRVVVVVVVVVDVTATHTNASTEKLVVPAKLDVSTPAVWSELVSSASKAVESLLASVAACCTATVSSYDWHSIW